MVQWNFLFIILDKMGFLRKFNSIVKLMFINVKAKVKINRSLYKPFAIKRRVRQRCLLVSYLFFIVEKVFNSIILKANKREAI